MIGVNSNEEDLDAAIGVGLGELAEITVNNDADPGNYDVSGNTVSDYINNCILTYSQLMTYLCV